MEKVKKQYIDVELVKALMKSRAIDEKTMAASMGVTVPTVKRFLSGVDQSHYSGDMIFKVAGALGVPADIIMHRDYR